jgi:hypothetical protein
MSAAGRSSRRISEMSRSSVKRSAWLPRCSTPLVSRFVAPASYSYPSEASPVTSGAPTHPFRQFGSRLGLGHTRHSV